MDNKEIINQIKASCPCFCDKDDDEIGKLIKTLISLLSISLCWNDTICGTFEYGLREETFDYIPNCMTCECCATIAEYPLFYVSKGADFQIVNVALYIYNGLNETMTLLKPTQYTYRNGKLLIDTSTLPSNCCTCSCDSYELRVEYESGYKQIPDCLLPLFCELLVAMSLSLSGCGSIDTCCNMTSAKSYQILKSKRLGDISYSWEIDKNHTSYLYTKMFNRLQTLAIAQMSCCNNNYNEERLWFVKSC